MRPYMAERNFITDVRKKAGAQSKTPTQIILVPTPLLASPWISIIGRGRSPLIASVRIALAGNVGGVFPVGAGLLPPLVRRVGEMIVRQSGKRPGSHHQRRDHRRDQYSLCPTQRTLLP